MYLETTYQTINFDPETSIATFYWKPNTQFMTEEEFLNELKVIDKAIRDNKPSKVLLISKDMNFLITPRLQDKVNAILIPAYTESNVKKLAVVLPKEVLMQISVETTIDSEKILHTFETKYFDTQEQAKQWLNV